MVLPEDQVHRIVDKLENLKTFIYREDGKGIKRMQNSIFGFESE